MAEEEKSKTLLPQKTVSGLSSTGAKDETESDLDE